MTIKPRFTVAKPPRVYQVAMLAGIKSSDLLHYLWVLGHDDIRSASSPIPLPVWHDLTYEYRVHYWYGGCVECANGQHGNVGTTVGMLYCECCREVIADLYAEAQS